MTLTEQEAAMVEALQDFLEGWKVPHEASREVALAILTALGASIVAHDHEVFVKALKGFARLVR